MIEIKKLMISELKKKHPNARPCGDKKSFKDCFTNQNITGMGWCLWYNLDDDTTSVLKEIDLIIDLIKDKGYVCF